MSKYIFISASGNSVRINTDAIIRIEVCKGLPVIFMNCGTQYVYSRHLKILEGEINSMEFIRPHQSHLVNFDYVEKINWRDSKIIMKDKSAVPISIGKRAELRRATNHC